MVGFLIGGIGSWIIFPTSEWLAESIMKLTNGTTTETLFDIIFGILFFIFIFLFNNVKQNEKDNSSTSNAFFSGIFGIVGFLIIRAIWVNAILPNFLSDNLFYISNLLAGAITFTIILTTNDPYNFKKKEYE
jgi:hypothetical protein